MMIRKRFLAVLAAPFVGAVARAQFGLRRRDVAVEIPSEDELATLQATVGIRVVNRRGTVLFESNPSIDNVADLYSELLTGAGLNYQGHFFSSGKFRKEVLRKLKDLLF